ncbi:hypothetical protein BDP81DRAFT_430609 [Colletotrichum phormii]|uniref:Uncharacterized protein n=1 Tax=Colletotrichum phormii TaxID=359342 RepID=A0AAI9ZNL4_9PEZI|nr:uncharacterized protein BDP81DRAFT_430609 [Colletotrichum phormii]KAK1634986.1 hypothetical protein BDP81DRAFT_430609 [Colletotrichum phormii]
MQHLKWNLDTLPRELPVNICEILYYDDHAASLASLSAANKTCRDAAVGVLVRTIKFTVSEHSCSDNEDNWSESEDNCSDREDNCSDMNTGSQDSLHLDALSCERMLHGNGVSSQVRRIYIKGIEPTFEKDFVRRTLD